MSVCLCAKISQNLRTGFDKIVGGARRGPETNRLDFGGDLDSLPLFSPIFHPHAIQSINQSLLRQ